MPITGRVVGFIRHVNLKNGQSKALVLADLVTLDNQHIIDYEKHRQFASEAEMNQAIQEAVETHLGMELHFAPSPAQLWLERIPLILSAVILVVGLYWRYGLGQ